MDLISRQAAIDLIENESRKWGDEYGVSDVLCDLSDMPFAQPERWIPVSERLPELDESVLATTAWNDITIAWRIGICNWFIHEGDTNAETDDIIAWMPLPSPYKGEQE